VDFCHSIFIKEKKNTATTLIRRIISGYYIKTLRLLFFHFLLFFLCVVLLLTSCQQNYSPKPKAYPRVSFPERSYTLFSPPTCPYEFEIPVYSSPEEDTLYFDQNIKGKCWYNIFFPDFNGTINFTYKPINDTQKLEKLIEDAHKLSFKHTKRADYIDEVVIENPHRVGGLLYEVGGDAASNVQFFLTDSVRHFVRGALYFNHTPNADSMMPVLEFLKQDLKVMLKTFRWK
jgi:gliding motility-associated lipoprotein GldD